MAYLRSTAHRELKVYKKVEGQYCANMPVGRSHVSQADLLHSHGTFIAGAHPYFANGNWQILNVNLIAGVCSTRVRRRCQRDLTSTL